MSREYVKVGNIIKPKRPSDGDAPVITRKSFSPQSSLLHNEDERRDGGEPSQAVDLERTSPPTNSPERISEERLKRFAKILKKDSGVPIPHHEALNQAAQEYGYRNFRHFKNRDDG